MRKLTMINMMMKMTMMKFNLTLKSVMNIKVMKQFKNITNLLIVNKMGNLLNKIIQYYCQHFKIVRLNKRDIKKFKRS